MRKFRYLLLGATLVTFLLMVIGNLVRINNASQGCPDWPTCYGQWFLPVSFFSQAGHAIQPMQESLLQGSLTQIQYAHRAAAGLSALLILIAACLAAIRFRAHRFIAFPLYAALILIGVEIILGRSSVLGQASGVLEVAHLGLALTILALVTFSTVSAFYTSAAPIKRLSISSRYTRLVLLVIVLTFVLMISGVVLVATGADQVCTGQVLCWDSSPLGLLQIAHRLLTGADSILVGLLFFYAWKNDYNSQPVLSLATSIGVLFVGQMLVGVLKVLRGMPLDLVWLHAAAPSALWAGLIALLVALSANQTEVTINTSLRVVNPAQRLRDFITLSKPIIVALLLVTTYAGMVVGAKHLPAASLTFWTLLSGGLAAGGASAVNQFIDRDLDRRMQRTSKRPLAAGRMTPAEGLAFGIGLCLLSFFTMAGFVNLAAALLSLAGMVYYVLLYSVILKRATVQNIVIGGGAGAIPPLVGWAAATGGLNFPSLFLFAIVFLWTPPHFWALALVRRNDYARAGIPMLPVVRGERVTRSQILIYTLELVGLTLLMPLFKLAGSFYLVSAVALGGLLIAASWRLYTQGGNKTAWMMYRYSSMYLALLFLAMVLDVFI